MPHADTRRPFTRRGPPTEEEERERLRKAREAASAALPPARSIPRTPFDPSQPTINPPGGRDNGPRTQAELTAADEARKAAGARPPVRPAPSQELLDRRRTRAELSAFNRAEAQRKAQERRKEMGLPETAQQRGQDIRTRAARHALLDGNTELVPRLQGSLSNATRRAQADPDLFPHNQIVRTTVNGRETFQRYNAIRRDFTPVTIDPLTGRIGIDTSDEAALSDAAVDDSFSTRITALRGLAADPDVDPNSAKQLEFIASGLEAIQEAVGVVGRAEALKQANTLYAKAAAFIELEEEPIPSVLKGLGDAVTPVEGFPGFFWTRDDKGNYKLQKAEVEQTEAAPTTSQEFFSQGDLKEQTSRFFTFRKQAVDELQFEAQAQLDEAVARFTTQETARVAAAQKTAKKDETIATRPFPGSTKAAAPSAEQIQERMQKITDEFFSLRSPAESSTSAALAPTPAAPSATTQLTEEALAAIAAEEGKTVEAIKAELGLP